MYIRGDCSLYRNGVSAFTHTERAGPGLIVPMCIVISHGKLQSRSHVCLTCRLTVAKWTFQRRDAFSEDEVDLYFV